MLKAVLALCMLFLKRLSQETFGKELAEKLAGLK
jgi:hypothetical protein